jgi:hypothetical protein
VDKGIAVWRIGQHLLIGRLQHHVGDHREELVLIALNNDEFADAHILDAFAALQAGAQPIDQRAAGDHAEAGADERWHSSLQVAGRKLQVAGLEQIYHTNQDPLPGRPACATT